MTKQRVRYQIGDEVLVSWMGMKKMPDGTTEFKPELKIGRIAAIEHTLTGFARVYLEGVDGQTDWSTGFTLKEVKRC